MVNGKDFNLSPNSSGNQTPQLQAFFDAWKVDGEKAKLEPGTYIHNGPEPLTMVCEKPFSGYLMARDVVLDCRDHPGPKAVDIGGAWGLPMNLAAGSSQGSRVLRVTHHWPEINSQSGVHLSTLNYCSSHPGEGPWWWLYLPGQPYSRGETAVIGEKEDDRKIVLEKELYETVEPEYFTVFPVQLPKICIYNLEILCRGQPIGLSIGPASHVTLGDVRVRGTSSSGILLSKCLSGHIVDCDVRDAGGDDNGYSLNLSSCENIEVTDGYYGGAKHLSIGGNEPCRNIKIIGAKIVQSPNEQRPDPAALRFHENCIGAKVDHCSIIGGIDISCVDVEVSNSVISGRGRCPLFLSPKMNAKRYVFRKVDFDVAANWYAAINPGSANRLITDYLEFSQCSFYGGMDSLYFSITNGKSWLIQQLVMEGNVGRGNSNYGLRLQGNGTPLTIGHYLNANNDWARGTYMDDSVIIMNESNACT